LVNRGAALNRLDELEFTLRSLPVRQWNSLRAFKPTIAKQNGRQRRPPDAYVSLFYSPLAADAARIDRVAELLRTTSARTLRRLKSQ
jgi:hypothetical protein